MSWASPHGAFIFNWWLAVLAAGWLVWPLLFRSLSLLPDRGLGLSKLLGLVLVAFVHGWIAYLFPPSQGSFEGLWGRPLIAVFVLAALSVVFLRRVGTALPGFVWERRKLILVYELVFTAAFLGYLWMRSFFPDATFDVERAGAEKWGNLSILTGLWRFPAMPGLDPWLSGRFLNYYYFNHWIWATLARLTATPPELAFNLGLATLFGLLLLTAASAGLALFERRLAMLWAVFLVALAGPLATWGQWGLVRGLGWGSAFRVFNFWAPSDVLPNTRNEFPAFNWLLGDLHAHSMGLLLLLAALCALAQIKRVREAESEGWFVVLMTNWPTALLGAILLGCMWATNAWDTAVVAVALFFLILGESLREFDWAGRLSQFVQGLLVWAIAGGLGVLALVSFQTRLISMPLDHVHNAFLVALPGPLSALGSVGLVEASDRTTPGQFLAFWGLFLIPMALLWTVRGLRKGSPAKNGLRLVGILAFLVVAAQLRHFSGSSAYVGAAVVATFIAALATLIQGWPHGRLGPRAQWIGLLVLTGLSCVIIPEFFFLDDPIDAPYQRYNTVFKLYYPAWALFGLALTGILVRWRDGRRLADEAQRRDEIGPDPFATLESPAAFVRRPRIARRVVASVVTACLLIAGGLYPILGFGGRVVQGKEWMRFHGLGRTLDALAFLSLPRYCPDDLRLGLWMRENLAGMDAIVETSGASYGMTGRISAISGIPCLMGWEQHQTQWRGGLFGEEDYPARDYAIRQIYESEDPGLVFALCEEFQVRHVVVGSLERRKYGGQGLEKFEIIGKPLARFGESVVYEIPPAGPEEGNGAEGSGWSSSSDNAPLLENFPHKY